MFTVRYAESWEYGHSCYVVVRPNGDTYCKFLSGVDADNKAEMLNQAAVLWSF
jgi:hypothetical protein